LSFVEAPFVNIQSLEQTHHVNESFMVSFSLVGAGTSHQENRADVPLARLLELVLVAKQEPKISANVVPFIK
jgi:hypothetical protein